MKKILFMSLILASAAANARMNVGREAYPFTTYDCTTEQNTKVQVQYYHDLANSTPHLGEVSVGGTKYRLNDLILKQKDSDRPQITILGYQDRPLLLNLAKDKATYQRGNGIEQPMNCKVTPPAAVPEDAI